MASATADNTANTRTTGIWYMDYRPSLSEIVGNERAKRGFLSWLNFRFNPQQKSERQRDLKNCALLYGPPGVGKSALVKAAAKEMGTLLIQLDASELRSREDVKKLLDGLSNRSTLFGETKKLLLIDDADAVYDDTIGYMILDMAKQSAAPVVLTAISKYARSLRFLRGMCAEFSFSRLEPDEVLEVLKNACSKLGLYAEEEELNGLARTSNGDARAALNDLQSWSFGSGSTRDTENEVKQAVEQALLSDSCTRALSSINTALSSADPDTIMLWVEENLPYYTQEGLDHAYEWLSKGESMMGLGERKLLFNLQRRGLEVAMCGISSRGVKQGEEAQIPWRLFRGRESIEAGKRRLEVLSTLASSLHSSIRKTASDQTLSLVVRAEEKEQES
ncbi:MAG: AAA family ATPase [Thermoprotei archaeon]